MSNGREVNLKKDRMRWWITLCFTFVSLSTYAQNMDTLRTKIDTIPRTDTLHIPSSKDSLDAPVEYSATDSIVIDIPAKKVILYNEARTKYKDMTMKAYKIEIDQPKRIVTATSKLDSISNIMRDSSGNIIGQPTFVQAENNMRADSIIYNIDTKKGITKSTYTNQGELFVYGDRIKKISDDSYFAFHGRFTTCNLDTPHFAFVANKMKLVNKKVAISGPMHPEFEGVPIPIYLPFGFFPLSQGRHSGLLPPQFATNEQYGLGLEGLGYYKVLSEHLDATIRTNIYSYGGYALFLSSRYVTRYRYSGDMNLSYQNVRSLSSIGAKEFTSTKVFNIRWSHTMDPKARPGVTFSANVNAGSTKFNQYIPNNPTANFQNQLSSSINYSKTSTDGKTNLTIAANHDQNSNTRLINLSLPNITYTVQPLYPFKSKEFVGIPKWYQQVNIGLTSTITNRASFYDSAINFKRLLDTAQWGARHQIPLRFQLPRLGPLQLSPSINYTEQWYDREFLRSWNSVAQKVDTTIHRGFYRDRNITFDLGLSLTNASALYGLYNFRKSSRVKAIRHTIRPVYGLSFAPGMAGSRNYYTMQIDSAGHTQRFYRYDGNLFPGFSADGSGPSASINFGIDNILEMKLRSRDTSATEDKKITLIDGFGFTNNYNLLADSFNLGNFVFNLRSTLFQHLNITASATMDPYQVDSNGFRINHYTWSGGRFSPGRITNGNFSITGSFQSKEKNQTQKNNTATSNNTPITAEEQQAELDYVRSHPAEFTDFNIPWNVSFSYSLNFSRTFRPDYKGFTTTVFSSLTLNGSFNLTPKWKLGMDTYYDLKAAKVQSIALNVSRDMHCWEMTINVIPVGPVRSFNIVLHPKSGLLRDLKINRSRYFYGGP